MAEFEVSLFRSKTDTTPVEHLPLGRVLRNIRTGTYRGHLVYVRQQRTISEDAYKVAKNNLPAFTPAGTFSPTRANANVAQATGLVHYDLDKLSDVVQAKRRLREDARVLYAFVSPSGGGLKFAMQATGIVDDATYKHAWAYILADLQERYPAVAVSTDQACRDISRLCFISDDPALYVNPQAAVVSIPPYIPREQPRKAYKPFTPASTDEERRRVEEALSVLPATDYALWLRISQALHASGASWAFDVWDTWSRGGDHYREEENHRKWGGFKSDGGRTLATVFHEAKEHGYQPTTRQPVVARTMTHTLSRGIARTIRRSL
jgi:VirE N-terminal domain/Primase C terminal 2 (PriCT-2)